MSNEPTGGQSFTIRTDPIEPLEGDTRENAQAEIERLRATLTALSRHDGPRAALVEVVRRHDATGWRVIVTSRDDTEDKCAEVAAKMIGSFFAASDEIAARKAAIRAREAEEERNLLQERMDEALVDMQEALGLLSDATTMGDIVAEVKRLKALDKPAQPVFFGDVGALVKERDRLALERPAVVAFLRARADGASSPVPVACTAMREALMVAAYIIERGGHMSVEGGSNADT